MFPAVRARLAARATEPSASDRLPEYCTAEVTSDYTGAMLCSVHHAPRYVAPHPSLRLGTPPKMLCHDRDRLRLGVLGWFSRKTSQRVQQPMLRRPGPVGTRPVKTKS